MATKAQLIAYAREQGVSVSAAWSKARIEQQLRDAGHDPDTVGPSVSQQAEEAPPPTTEQQEEDVAPEPFTEEQASEKAVTPEDAYDKGWWGGRPEVFDDDEFTLQTGPNSPSAHHYEDPESYDPEETIVTDEMPSPEQTDSGDDEEPSQQQQA